MTTLVYLAGGSEVRFTFDADHDTVTARRDPDGRPTTLADADGVRGLTLLAGRLQRLGSAEASQASEVIAVRRADAMHTVALPHPTVDPLALALAEAGRGVVRRWPGAGRRALRRLLEAASQAVPRLAAAEEVDRLAPGDRLLASMGGYPQLTPAAAAWVASRGVSQAQQAWLWSALCRQWLSALQPHLGPDAHLVEAGRVLLLSTVPRRRALGIADSVADALMRIERILPSLGPSPAGGPRPVVYLPDRETYYRYVSPWYPASGDFATSGAMFIGSVYGQLVLWGPGTWGELGPTIPHELTHAHLCQRHLPSWLEEGLAQLMEATGGGRPPVLDREHLDKQRHLWEHFGLDLFWSGRGFHVPELQEVSYRLAWALVDRIVADARDKLEPLLRTARRDDAGQGAVCTHLGTTLGSLAGAVLGPGRWEPRPPYR